MVISCHVHYQTTEIMGEHQKIVPISTATDTTQASPTILF